MNKDLTTGKPESVLWRFCLPLFGSVIFQQLYNIADSLIAGKYIGENALSAVGNSYEITLIFIAFAFGCNMGCSVIVSQLFGAKELGKVKTAVYTTFLSTAVLVLLLTALGLIFGRQLLLLINTPLNILDDSKLYLDIYIYGLFFMFFYNVSNGIFSALGDSKTPFLFLAVSSLSNIVVDYVFVKFLCMGIAGVAWATFLCQGVSSFLATVIVLNRIKNIETSDEHKFFDIEILKKILVVAIPSTLQQSFISIGNIIIQGVINDFGTGVIAGYSVSVKLNNLVITSLTTLGNGVSNFSAQNLGAKKIDRIKKGHVAGLKLVWIICLPFAIIYAVYGKYLVYFFLDNPTPDALNTGRIFLIILAPFYFVVATKLVCDGVLRGIGLMREFMIATFTDLILRVVLAIILSKMFGSIGIWCAWPVGWSIGTIVSMTFYRKSINKLINDSNIVEDC